MAVRPRARQHMRVFHKPVALNGKLYSRGMSNATETVLEYTPGIDHWNELPHTPFDCFTITILNNQLALIGGRDKSKEMLNTIFTFDDQSRQWILSNEVLPTARYYPLVIRYQDCLIVAGGHDSNLSYIPDVNILHTTSNKWITAKSLPTTDHYESVLIEDTVYLVGQSTRSVLQAHVLTLISRSKSGVWETLPNTTLYNSYPTSIDRLLLTMGGSDESDLDWYDPTPSTSFQLFNTSTRQWWRVGDLPEPMLCHCIELSGQLFLLGSGSVYTADVVVNY